MQTKNDLAKLIWTIAKSVAAGQYLEEPIQPEELDPRCQDQDKPIVDVLTPQIQIDSPDSDGASMVVHRSSTNSQRGEDYSCPWNDSGICAEPENSSVEFEEAECSTADQTASEHRTTSRDSSVRTDRQHCADPITVDQATGSRETHLAEPAVAHSNTDSSRFEIGTILDSKTRKSQMRRIREQENSQAVSRTGDADDAGSGKPPKLLRERSVTMALHAKHRAAKVAKEAAGEEAEEKAEREAAKTDKKEPSTTPQKQNIPSFPTPPHEPSSRSPSPPSPLSKMSYKVPAIGNLLPENFPMTQPGFPTPPPKPHLIPDSITLRHKQLSKNNYSEDPRKPFILLRSPKVKQVKETRIHTPPTLKAYETTPGKYSKDLQHEFGEIYFGSPSLGGSTPKKDAGESAERVGERPEEADEGAVPSIKASSPAGKAGLGLNGVDTGPQSDEEGDSSLIIVV